jgi:hypothetical protein
MYMRKTAMKKMTERLFTSAVMAGGLLGQNTTFSIPIIDDSDIEGKETESNLYAIKITVHRFSSSSTAALATADNEAVPSVGVATTKTDNSITGETINETAGVNVLAV